MEIPRISTRITGRRRTFSGPGPSAGSSAPVDRVTGLVAELTQLLNDEDPRWYAFGLNRPADPKTPSVPATPVLTPGVAGTVHAAWSRARRAARYRVYKKEANDEDYQHAVTAADSEAMISGLQTGGTVQIRVSAANDAGESLPSAAAQIMVPSDVVSEKTVGA